ncbi:hypothetical protein IDJ75_12550 [Mucilaginibacter rigui]|uniref:Uncharacterized protein n=2 Tax=Mucilaginibacter rigui TaxID=534635 RepID=A0ABR7X915_9SPHI|nr:hypothetical protein [Mucilaginibacter rigui]
MQDKEIDQLFRSEFDDFKVEPSAAVWGNVASQLDKKRRSLKTSLSVAASLLVLLSAGLYFVAQTKDNIKPTVQLAAVKNDKPVKATVAPETALPKIVQPQIDKVTAVNAGTASRKQKTRRVKQQHVLPVTPLLKVEEPEQQLAQASRKSTESIKFTVPDKNTPILEKIDAPEDMPFKTNTLAAQSVTVPKTMAVVAAKKHRIRSLGDLINVVVSKVDKRKDKLIEFSSTKDEDESIVSGLNLGFIKIKKEDK